MDKPTKEDLQADKDFNDKSLNNNEYDVKMESESVSQAIPLENFCNPNLQSESSELLDESAVWITD